MFCSHLKGQAEAPSPIESSKWRRLCAVLHGQNMGECGPRPYRVRPALPALGERSLAGVDRQQGMSEGSGCPCYLLSEGLRFTAQYKAWYTGSFQYVLVA